MKHEKSNELYFTSLQSPTGIELLKHYNINPLKIDSLVLIENDKVFVKSPAALKLGKYLKGVYSLGFVFLIVPPFIRNWFYDYISKNRYKWYGKQESCIVPDENLAKRFL